MNAENVEVCQLELVPGSLFEKFLYLHAEGPRPLTSLEMASDSGGVVRLTQKKTTNVDLPFGNSGVGRRNTWSFTLQHNEETT